MSRKTAIPCTCGCDVVMLWECEPWCDEPHLLVAEWSVSYAEGRFRSRARAAWRVLRGKEPWMHAIVLQEDGIAQLREAIR